MEETFDLSELTLTDAELGQVYGGQEAVAPPECAAIQAVVM